jgi:hypothetical protein
LSPNPDDRPQRGQEVAAELTEIARQYGIESSGPRIAQFLTQLFPSETGVPEHPGASVKEIVRVFPEELTTKEKSPVSFTPSSGSNSSKALGPVDVSETYRRRTGELSAQPTPDDPDHAQQPSGPSSPLVTLRSQRTPAQASKLPELRANSSGRILIAIAIAIALAIATYLLRSS